MKLGMIGLGRMGGNMAARLREHGHDVVGYSRTRPSDCNTLEELVAALEAPRVVWSMVPAGEATETTITTLADILSDGDVVIDGGNAFYRDSIRRADLLRDRGISFVDAGVSGGIWGRDNGYALMVGGESPTVEKLRPIFEALAPPDGGFAHVGPVGGGHFTKMVHNGIEYGVMQSFAEGYELLRAADLDIDVAAALTSWQKGSVVRSWLLDLLVDALNEDPNLEGVRGVAEDSGEGRWTVQEGVRLGVATPAISAALYARFVSQQDDSLAMRVIAALRNAFGGHAVTKAE
jgi:6-phosphogluconate dehydrogenase